MDNLINVLQEEIKKNLPETSSKLLKEELERLYEIEAYNKELQHISDNLSSMVSQINEKNVEKEKIVTEQHELVTELQKSLKTWDARESKLIERESKQIIVENNQKNAENQTAKIFELVDKFITKKRYSTTAVDENNSNSSNSTNVDGLLDSKTINSHKHKHINIEKK